MTKITSFDRDLARMQVLATSTKDTTFLTTPSGPDYINKLNLVRILPSEPPVRLATVHLKDVQIQRKKQGLWSRLMNQGKETTSLHEAIMHLKTRYQCEIVFKINSEGDIAVGSVLPSGPIISLFLLKKLGPADN